jgi:hypothetical protein
VSVEPIDAAEWPTTAQGWLRHFRQHGGLATLKRIEQGLAPPPRKAGGGTVPDLTDFLAEQEPEYVWVIENVLEERDRVILTAAPGGGQVDPHAPDGGPGRRRHPPF